MSETIIELRSVSKRFDSLWALRDVDLSVRRGEFLTLLGPSGCGETTLVTVHGRLKGFDRHLVEAAKDLGASEYQTVRHIILPLLLPAVLAGWLLSFTLSMDDVIISFFVTGPGFEVLPLRIFPLVRQGVKPEINGSCTIMFGLTLVFITLYQTLQKEKP